VERRAAARDVGFRATSVKIMQDGVVENFSAGLLDSYLDSHGCPTGNRGLSFVDPIALRAHVTALDAAGFQVHFHAIGDRAVHEALDAVEAAQASNGRTDARHHVAHVQVVARVDVPRFKELRTSATIQPLWAAHEPQMDKLTIPFLGADRAALQYPFGDLAASGAHLAAGSDWPVSSPNPLLGAHVAVNRVLPGARGAEAEPLYPHNRIDLATALRAYTAGSAYVNHLDDETGRLEVGLLADRDPFARAAEEIASTRVVATYVEGKSVFRAGSG
jgi:predicted amidohydrolase YtcJ